jgi:hypothetical protein
MSRQGKKSKRGMRKKKRDVRSGLIVVFMVNTPTKW